MLETQFFQTTTELMMHQREAVAKMLPTRAGALFMEMGTGKTLTAIELVKLRRSKIDKVVWFCPVSLKRTIADEILKHTNFCSDSIHIFDDKTSETKMPEAFWYICGIESVSSSNRVTLAINNLITEKTFVVVDEATYIKGHRSMRTERITTYSERARYRLILTGTPLTQGIVDLYAQMRFLSPKILGYRSFYSFANNHLEYSDRHPGLIVRSLKTEQLAAKIAPYVYQVTKKECLDLPDKTFQSRYFSMTDVQREMYETAKVEILQSILDTGFFDTQIAVFRLFTALQQITSGFWNKSDYDPQCRYRVATNYEMFEFGNHRTNALVEAVAQIPAHEKIIIWAKFRYDVEQIKAAIAEHFPNDKIALFIGDLSETERGKNLDAFRRDARFFIATPSCGGHGLTLNEANYVIFYNNGFKYSERIQAEDRCHRIGQKKSVTYIDIVCSSSIDERIQNALMKKESVVESFKREVEKVKKDKLREKLMAL